MFSSTFYETILWLFINEPLLYSHINDIQPTFFNKEHYSKIFQKIKDIYNKYESYINPLIFREIIPKICEYLDEKKSEEIIPYVKDELRKYIYITDVSSLSSQLYDFLNKDFKNIDTKEITNHLERMLKYSGIEEEGFKEIDYFEKPENRILNFEQKTGIPTGIYEIDENLLGGGLGKGELGILLGLAGFGKSATMVNFAIAALSFKKKVLYISLEMDAEIVAHRTDMCLTNNTTSEVLDNFNYVSKRIQEFKNFTKSEFKITRFPSNSKTVPQLKIYIKDLKKRGFIPDIIFIDYADIIKPHLYKDDRRLALGAIYLSLRQVAVELDVPIWTASQGNRKGTEEEFLDMKDVAEDFSKNFTADIIISFNLKKKESNIASLFLVKNRNATSKIFVECYCDWNRMLLVDRMYEKFYK